MILAPSNRVFGSFFLFGLLNNILYVVILSAAVDLVGALTPKAVVLLADVVPLLLVKVCAPFVVHLVAYPVRVWSLVGLLSVGMVVVSQSPSVGLKIGGIVLASILSGLGELTCLQLTHFYRETDAISGFLSGTGGAGLAGSFIFMALTNLAGVAVPMVLLLFAVVPLGMLFGFYVLLPVPIQGEYVALEEPAPDIGLEEAASVNTSLWAHIRHTVAEMRPLLMPYMAPLCAVYVSEYVINQGIAPTLLFPLAELPHWLFQSYRDIYVVYGFLYQMGVFVLRSSIRYVRVRRLYLLSYLQLANVVVTLVQSVTFTVPFGLIWFLLLLVFYEGLLGGFLYVNTFMSVSEDVLRLKREFSMGCVGISDSFGVMLAGCINWWLEAKLCDIQVGRGRDWCKTG